MLLKLNQLNNGMYNLNDCKVKYITKEEWENNCIEAFTKLIKK